MADYKDYYKSDCIYCGSFYGHKEDCRSPHMARLKAEEALKENGFELVEGNSYTRVNVYKCLNGCGSIVWEMKAHRENVCPLGEL